MLTEDGNSVENSTVKSNYQSLQSQPIGGNRYAHLLYPGSKVSKSINLTTHANKIWH